jgi:hypothetical protein
MDAKYGDKARGGSLGLSLRLPRRRGSGTGTAVRRTICALLAFALLVYLPLRSIAGESSSAVLGADCGPVAIEAGDEPAPADLRSLVGDDDNLDGRRFTVLLNTFKRPDLLKKAVAHYATCPDVAEIRVVWSEQTSPPTRDKEAGAFFGPKPSMVTYDAHPTTSIQNRFDPPAAGAKQISTTAVFNVDEDVRMPCAALSAGFKAWRANADVLVGYYPRTHVPDATGCGWRYVWDDLSLWRHGDFSIVLTKAAFMRTGYMSLYAQGLPAAARRFIDEHKNCEDIAMQILTAKVTGKPPVYVPVPTGHYLWAKLEGFGVAGISKGSGHHVHRGECITYLSAIIGGGGPMSTPLVRAPLVAWGG